MRAPSKVLKVLDQAFLVDLPKMGYPELGPGFEELTGCTLHESLVSHRILSKYEVPDDAVANTRKEVSILKMRQYDINGVDSFDYRKLNCESRRDFLHAHTWLRDLFKGFKRAYGLRFPSNETFISAKGMTDLFYKLSEDDQWLVSPDVVDDCVNILLRHRALLNVVKHRYRKKYGENGRIVLQNVRDKYIESNLPMAKIRFWMVKFMFRATTRLHRTARITAIAKNNKSDRVITLEALWNMVAQLSYASDVRDLLRDKLGYDLTCRQDVHRSLIRSGKATIDLKSASDSNWMAVLKQLLPARVFRDLSRLRTGILEYRDGKDIAYQPLNMLAPMGCGFTFEIMTVVLLAHCRVLDKGASVFGDDIIIDRKVASALIRNLESQGWVINEDKSFTRGNFRESCGAFCDLNNQKLLLSYDIKRPSTTSEINLVMGKLWNVGHALPAGPLRTFLSKLYADLILILHKDLWFVEFGPTNLREDVVYIPQKFGSHVTTRSTKVTKRLNALLQRQIEVVLTNVVKLGVQRPPSKVGPVHYACYMRRGMSYYVPNGREKTIRVQVDKWSGSPLKDFRVGDLEAISL